jgi:hypothetical protein
VQNHKTIINQKIMDTLKIFLKYLIVICFYLLIASIANWALLFGPNMMKWDIINEQLPFATFVQDCLKNGILPLWNPMINFGTPYYSVVSLPVWYPITHILEWFGYSMRMTAVEYILHITLAGFGAYLLISSYLKKNKGEYFISLASGLFYAFSGVFLSNAQHIMIIISAAWIPYVLFFARKSILENKLIYIFLAGACGAMIMLGGYPELFAALFIILLPFLLVENYLKNPTDYVKVVISSIAKYSLILIFSILGSFMTALPFALSMPLITRGSGGALPEQYSLNAFLTTFLPGVENGNIMLGDISMVNAYMGLLTLLTLPSILISKKRGLGWFICIAAFALLMMQSGSLFLHPLFYRFLPLFSNLRFPSLWRCIFALFILIPCGIIWNDLITDNEECKKLLKRFITIALSFMIIGFALSIIASIIQNQSVSNELLFYSEAFLITTVLSGLYIAILAKKDNIKPTVFSALILLVCIIEVLTFQYKSFPITIGITSPNDMSQASVYLSNKYLVNNRVKSLEFKDAKHTAFRGSDPASFYQCNLNIIFQRTLDEAGYFGNYIFIDTDRYWNSVNRMITTQNPTAYFTNNIITYQETSLDTWLSNPFESPAAIFANTKGSGEPLNIEATPIFKTDLQFKMDSNIKATIENPYTFNLSDSYSKWRKITIIADTGGNNTNVTIQFICSATNITKQYSGVLSSTQAMQGVDIYFPIDYNPYDNIILKYGSACKILKCYYSVGERMSSDIYTYVESFTPDKIVIKANAPTDGYLVIRQSWNKGWKATVNGSPAVIEKVSGLFRGIYLHPGEYTVELDFKPWDFYVGAAVTVTFWILLILLCIFCAMKTLIRNHIEIDRS